MKRLIIGPVIVAALLSANLWLGHGQERRSSPGQPDSATVIPPSNPLRVALLKWYAANRVTSFNVGANTEGLAFDGASMWIASAGSNTVTKVRVSDGAILGTFGAGQGPVAAAFDGANVWVVNENDNTVSKLRASDGTTLGTFGVGRLPIGVAFDGAYIWVPNQNDWAVSNLRARDGKTLGSVIVATPPELRAFDGV